MTETYAAIDIGTLKVKFLVASVDKDGTINSLSKSNKLTCLGCDMNRNGGYVSKRNLSATITELLKCKEKLNQMHVSKYRVVSTHAIRNAKNKEYVLKMIHKKTGFNVDDISQHQEAELFFNVVLRDFPKNKRYAVIDIGGGSVQLLTGTPDNLEQAHLLPIGAQFLHAKFTRDSDLSSSFTTQTDIEHMRNYIIEQILPIDRNQNTPIIYGSSNVLDLFQAINIPLDTHMDSASHPYQTYARYLGEFLKSILPLNYAQREKKYPFQDGYMWGIDKAFISVTTLAQHLDSPFIIPSNSNISQGIINSLRS